MRLNRFEANGQTYTFPATIAAYDCNFADVQSNIVRTAGMSGGVSLYGAAPAPTPVGRIRQSFTLVSPTRAGMDTLRDSIRALSQWGAGRLYVRPTDYPLRAERWTHASVAAVDMPEDTSGQADLHQRLTLNFDAPDARWYSIPPSMALGLIWDQGTWDGYRWQPATSSPEVAISTTAQTFTVTNSGNAPALPVLEAQIPASCLFTIARMVNGVAYEALTFQNILTRSVYLRIDARGKTVRANGASQFIYLNYSHPDWIRLLLGVNTFRVSLSAGTGTLITTHWDTWV
jgi:hypothetical protein